MCYWIRNLERQQQAMQGIHRECGIYWLRPTLKFTEEKQNINMLFILDEHHLLQHASGLRGITPGINFWHSPFHSHDFAVLPAPCRAFILSFFNLSVFLFPSLSGDSTGWQAAWTLQLQCTGSSAPLAAASLSGMGQFFKKQASKQTTTTPHTHFRTS